MATASVLWLTGCAGKQSSEDVYAKVNGRKISRAEVEKYYRNQTEGSPQQPSDEQAASLKLSILRELIDNETRMQRAEQLGLLASDEGGESKMNESKATYTKEEFDERLKDRNTTIDELKR